MATKAKEKTKVEKASDWQALPALSMKKCGADGKDAIREGKNIFMVRVFGEAAALKEKESRSGDPYQYLIGEFRLLNGKGEKFESSKLFLPGTLMEAIEGALGAASGKPVKFAYDIFAAPDSDVTIGYRYAAKTLLKTEASDRLSELTAELGSIK